MKKSCNFLPMLIISLISILLTNCKKDNNDTQNTIQNITGYAQKGPFINGSSVTVYDLQSDLSPSGKTFNAVITDNKGTFQLSNISLSSNYFSLRADGFYYNEISGQQSVAQITLYALSDISSKSDININILTHLEKTRVEYLIQQGKSFTESKIQAQKEILAIFSIQKSNIRSSENLNIAESEDDNGILLAISSILQGYNSESELTELLSNISEDIKSDGVLNSDILGSSLINQAALLDTIAIKNNLAKRYNEIGSTLNIPNFGKYIKLFLDSTKYIVTNNIEYPISGTTGPNILSIDQLNYPSRDPNNEYDPAGSITAKLPKGTSIKVIFIPDFINKKSVSSDTSFHSDPGYYSDYAIWSVINSGWSHSDTLYVKNHTGIFYNYNVESNRILDAKFDLLFHGGATIEIYENGNSTASRIKHITW